MNIVTGTTGSSRPIEGAERERLVAAMRDLEGVFVQELFKAMRATVPDEGIVNRGSGEEVFTSLLDERLASLVPEAWQHDGLEAALRRQFRLDGPDAAAPAIAPTTPPSAATGTGSIE